MTCLMVTQCKLLCVVLARRFCTFSGSVLAAGLAAAVPKMAPLLVGSEKSSARYQMGCFWSDLLVRPLQGTEVLGVLGQRDM
jgi:hypothetical protein